MIVISGALLVIAVVFLGIGLYGSLGWVYASIVVSFLAFVFMLVALRQQRSAARDEPVPPLHPLGLTKRPAPEVAIEAEAAASDVTLVPPVPAPDDEATVAEPDLPLVPATRKSAAKKATTSAAKTTATKKPAPAKKAPPAKKAASRTTAAKKTTASDPEKEPEPASDPAPRKTAPRKTAPRKTAPRKSTPRKSTAKKPVAPDSEQPTQLAMTDEAEPTEPSES